MTRRDSRTYRAAAQARAKVLAAQRELTAQPPAEAPPEEPIHRYVYPIPQPAPAACPTAEGESTSAALTQILEQLSCQNQLTVDLLGAVNALTAALLCKRT